MANGRGCQPQHATWANEAISEIDAIRGHKIRDVRSSSDTHMSDSQRIWLLLGAGISAGPPSNLPLWGEIARDTAQFLYRTLEYKIRATGGDGYLHARGALQLIESRAYPETVLECLTRAYGRTGVTRELCSLLSPPDCAPNGCHNAIAQLCKQGKIAGVVTTNFDTLLESALDRETVPYCVVTTGGMNDKGLLPLVKVHGTITELSSLVFTRNEYYLGMPQGMRDALRSALTGSIIIIAGYSGNDMDVFPFIRSMIDDQLFAEVHVVDRVRLSDNKRFASIGHCIEYHHGPAEKFLCELAGTSPPFEGERRKRRVAAIAPTDDKYPAALFFGDCLLGLDLNSLSAFRLFFLTQDIVEEETGDLRQLCISLLAKSHALFDINNNSWGESEYSAGRTLLHRVLENSDLPSHKVIFSEFGSSLAALEMEADAKRGYSGSAFMGGRFMPDGPDRFDSSPRDVELLNSLLYWELRTRIRVCFSAMAIAASQDPLVQEQHNILAVPEKLLFGFRHWQELHTANRATDELPFLPLFYSEYFAAYRSLLVSDLNAGERINQCIQLARQRGFYTGASQCYFLKRTHRIELSQAERRDYAAIQDYCGVDEQRNIAPLFRPGQAMFSLSINRYKPPVEGSYDAGL